MNNMNEKEEKKELKLNRVEKRAIEAKAIVPLIRAVGMSIGEEGARRILKGVNQLEAYYRGKEMNAAGGRNGIEELVREVESWGEGGVWEMEVLEQTPATYFFNVLRCPYFEKYRELGLEEYGVALSCCRDEPHARGFNSRLRLARTKTLMEGEDCCDFRYTLLPG